MAALSFKRREFLLDGQPFRIFSGAIHYFRVVPEYWQDRLEKARACGLNTVETYVPWNLHEPKPGNFQHDGILDLRKFIKMAADLGLFVIFRPGPYICSEWDFGGLPSWLLADPQMRVRSNYPGYQRAVERYFGWLLPHIADLQYSRGGPIIAVQVENEYGSFSDDPAHLEFIKDTLLTNQITELLVTSDNESASKTAPFLNGVLPTANGQTVEEVKASFDRIAETSPEYPLMVMEFWTGWFDHWGYPHETRGVDVVERTLRYVLQHDASVNFYMFHGGTNFGFTAGALNLSRYKPDVTSYDYDAPLSEDGQMTDKSRKIKEIVEEELGKLGLKNGASLPVDQNNRATKAVKIRFNHVMNWSNMTVAVTKTTSSAHPQYMEMYTYGTQDVQSFGYIVYRKVLEHAPRGRLALPGVVRDRATVLVNGDPVGQVTWDSDDPSVELDKTDPDQVDSVLDVVVENLGRVNYTTKDNQAMLNSQRKGISGEIRLDGTALSNWKVLALDFNSEFTSTIQEYTRWEEVPEAGVVKGPALFKATFFLEEQPKDYFIQTVGWKKGIILVNGFNIGRYWNVGPQKTLYVPGPLLRAGENVVVVFEEDGGTGEMTLGTEPSLG